MVNKHLLLSRRFALTVLVVLLVSIVAFWHGLPRLNVRSTLAQTLSGCPPLTTEHKGWAKDTTVYYNISNLPEPLKSQAQDAFAKWTTANESNGSGVKFKDVNSQTPPANAAITFVVGPVPGGAPAQARIIPNPDTGIVESAVFTIDANNPQYFYNHPAIPGYETAYLKAVLHEIGHTMGLKDAPYDENNPNCGGQTAGNSVMNLQCGINDMDGMTAINVTGCDNQSVKSNPQYPPTPTPTPTPTFDCFDNDNDGYGFGSDCLGPDCNDSNPFTTDCPGGGGSGGGGGGGGGGGTTTCSGYSYYYSESSGGCAQTYLRTVTWCDDGTYTDESEYIGEGCVLD